MTTQDPIEPQAAEAGRNPATGAVPTVIVHPLVLLSVVDHYNRVAKNTKKRVVGVLLGKVTKDSVHVSNCYALPFEEDEKDPTIWFLDHNYLESMFEMFKKVNASERIMGWYHSGPKLRASDLEINQVLRRYVPNPVLVIIDAQHKSVGLPVDSYMAVEEIHDDGTTASITFNHLPSDIQAEEAEEIGVEHLLRDIMDHSQGSLSTRLTATLKSLDGLSHHLESMEVYLKRVANGEMPVNHRVVALMQDMLNLLPGYMAFLDKSKDSMEVEGASPVENTGKFALVPQNVPPSVAESFNRFTHDQLLVVYLSSLCRAVMALHDLINNKLENRDWEANEKKTAEEKEKEKEKAAIEKEEKGKEAKGKEAKGKETKGKEDKKQAPASKK